jgi:hypothetical protein
LNPKQCTQQQWKHCATAHDELLHQCSSLGFWIITFFYEICGLLSERMNVSGFTYRTNRGNLVNSSDYTVGPGLGKGCCQIYFSTHTFVLVNFGCLLVPTPSQFWLSIYILILLCIYVTPIFKDKNRMHERPMGTPGYDRTDK